MKVKRFPLLKLLAATVALWMLMAQAARPAERAEKYALVIGVTGYPSFREADRLQYADADARSFAQLLETEAAGAFKGDNIRLLINQQATRVNIFKEIRWIGSKANSDDVVYVFFAGHGVSDDNGRAYFMPFDGDPSIPDAMGMRADQFKQMIQEGISARQIIFFIDACHAAAAYSRAGSTRRDAGNIIPQLRELWDRQLAGLQEVNMGFFSTGSNEFSIEDDALKHGIFTWYLIEGLQGKADANRDGKVTAGELRSYLSRNVEEHAHRKSAQQTPGVSPAFDASRILAFTTPATAAASGKIGGGGIQPELPPVTRQAPNAARLAEKVASPTPKPLIRFTPRGKQDRKPGEQNRYIFNIWVETSPADTARIDKVVYDFIYESNPLRLESDGPTNFFGVSYEGWGCYQNVVATFYLKNPAEIFKAPPFDLCQVLSQ